METRVKRLVFALSVALLPLSRGSSVEDPSFFKKEGGVKTGSRLSISLSDLRPGDYYGLTVSLPDLAALGETDAVDVSISDAQGLLVSKTLHAGDPDLTATIRPRAPGEGKVEAAASGASERSHRVEVYLSRMQLSGKARSLICANPSSNWRDA